MAIIYLTVLLVVYFIPTFIAAKRKHLNKMPIIVVNVFLGWTLIGWVIALAWALTSNIRHAEIQGRARFDQKV
jgi:ABC-type transport system involved in cytochrome c biogenesis permease component